MQEASRGIHTIAINLAKTAFHLVALNLHGEIVVRKKFSRTRLARANDPAGRDHFEGVRLFLPGLIRTLQGGLGRRFAESEKMCTSDPFRFPDGSRPAHN